MAVVAFIAIFAERFFLWYTRPKLEISINNRPPECQSTPVGDDRTPAYFFRLRVSNRGMRAARNVEVFFAELKRSTQKDFHEVPDFLPMNLQWTHTHGWFMESISPDMYKHCDIGVSPFPNGNIPVRLFLTLQVAAFTEAFILKPGVYEAKLAVGAANISKTTTKDFRIEISGEWSDNEEEMLSQHIQLNEI